MLINLTGNPNIVSIVGTDTAHPSIGTGKYTYATADIRGVNISK